MITIPYSKIEKAVLPPDQGRAELAHVHFDAETQTLRAADGFIAAIIPVEITTTDGQPDDKSGFIPVDAFKTGRKRAGRSRLYLDASDGIITMPFDNDDAATIQWKRPDAGYRFPDLDALTPNYDPDADDTVSIAFDAKLLATLAETLIQNDDNPRRPKEAHVRLTFSREKQGPIHVTPIPDNGRVKGRFGLLMPVHNPKV